MLLVRTVQSGRLVLLMRLGSLSLARADLALQRSASGTSLHNGACHRVLLLLVTQQLLVTCWRLLLRTELRPLVGRRPILIPSVLPVTQCQGK